MKTIKDKSIDWFCHRCGTSKNVYKRWIKEAEDFDNDLINKGRQKQKQEDIFIFKRWLEEIKDDVIPIIIYKKIKELEKLNGE